MRHPLLRIPMILRLHRLDPAKRLKVELALLGLTTAFVLVTAQSIDDRGQASAMLWGFVVVYALPTVAFSLGRYLRAHRRCRT